MNNWLSNLTEGFFTPIECEVKVGNKTTIGYFKRISAAQRQDLLRGQRVVTRGDGAEIEIELGANEASKHKLVFICACNPDGTPLFNSVREVAALGASVCNALYEAAKKVNEEGEEAAAGNG